MKEESGLAHFDFSDSGTLVYVRQLHPSELDVSPDGQRFVMISVVDDPETAPLRHLNVITNFFENLREKVP